MFKIVKPRRNLITVHSIENILEEINLLNFNELWDIKNRDCYSNWFLEEVKLLKNVLPEFIKEGYSPSVCTKYNYNFRFIRNLIFFILSSNNIILAIFKANRWKGKLGLELAKGRLKEFQKDYNRFPIQRDKGLNGLHNAPRNSYWKKFGIKTWNDLLKNTFGEVNHQYGTLHNSEGLERAKREISRFYFENKSLPTARTKGMSQYVNIISRGLWKEFGINTWNDLLFELFGEINKESRMYVGKKGYHKAKQEMINFKEMKDRIPKATDNEMQGITTAIKRQYWSEFDIFTWNDMLFKIFGKVNKRNKYWTGKNGFNRAKDKIQNHYLENRTRPTQRTKGMGGIVKAIQRGYWSDFGVTHWSDLLKVVFESKNK